MLKALRRRRLRRSRATQEELPPALDEDQELFAEGPEPPAQAGPADPDDDEADSFAELMLTDVVDPLDGRHDVDLGSIDGVREAPLPPPLELSEPRPLPRFDDPRDAIAHAGVFGMLSVATVEKLKERVEVRTLREGEVVFREGEPSDALYVIASGAVVPETGTSTPVRLSVLGEGECFGEIGLITETPRTATVRTLVDSVLLVIDRRLLRKLTARDANLVRTLTQGARQRIVDSFLKTSPLFTRFEAATRNELISEFRLIEAEDGTELVEQGTPAPAFFLVLTGAVRVLRSTDADDKELAVLGPGGFFGEMSLLDHAPAVAWVVSLGTSWLLALPRSRFERLLAARSELSEHLSGIALMRHHQNHLAFGDATPVHGRVDLF